MPAERRFHGPALMPTVATTLFTAAEAKSVVQTIQMMNNSGSAVTMTLSIGVDGSGARIYDAYILQPKELKIEKSEFTLATGDVLQGFSNTAGAVSLTVSGRVLDNGWGSDWGSSWGD